MHVSTQPFADQTFLPFGLRQSLSVFQQPHYLETAVQGFFNILSDRKGQTLVLGGDGQALTQHFLQIILKLAAANGFGRVIVGTQGLLSPVIVSYLIRRHSAIAGILLSIHPSLSGGDIHLDCYLSNGAKAPTTILEAIQERIQIIQNYYISEERDISLNRLGTFALETLEVEIINSAAVYEKLMDSIFDFDAIQHFFKQQSFRLSVTCLDPTNYAYSQHLLEKKLGLFPGTVNFEMAPTLLDPLIGTTNLGWKIDPPDLTCVLSGTQYGIFGTHIGVTASDSLAIMMAHAPLIPAYRGNVTAVARSLFGSVAIDHVALALGIPCYETPSEWFLMSQLMDVQGVTFAGNEEGEIGASYSRETDPIWPLLFWLNILAARPQSILQIVQNHWQQYGRNFHGCQIYENFYLPPLYEKLQNLGSLTLKGKEYGRYQVAYSHPLSFYDAVKFQQIEQLGLALVFTEGSRLIFRLDPLVGHTDRGNLTVYVESYEPDGERQLFPYETVLSPLFDLAEAIAELTT
ncbi:MAG: alpha-D-glucose phosphate-specific phosphoglucomutase [Snowella sp.]|nr:alpha-D-glucose phosphate-specific phosphoglucomutase [Snowella sp.]